MDFRSAIMVERCSIVGSLVVIEPKENISLRDYVFDANNVDPMPPDLAYR